MDAAARIFDRRLHRIRRDRAAARAGDREFLHREVALRLADRLEDVRRTFSVALDLGCRDGTLSRMIEGRSGVRSIVRCDLSPAMARRAGPLSLAGDEEALPFGPASFDLVVSSLSLHWVNDLPGALTQIRMALKPDGLFLAAMLGGETLRELRTCLLEAEAQETGGASPRVSPFADLRDAGALLQRAGFALPVADLDRILVTYESPLDLLRDLRGMGESNAVHEQARGLARREVLLRAATLYQERYGMENGRVPATFEVIFMHGWAPHHSQQQPLRPGSAGSRLADALGDQERSAGEPARPANPRGKV
jgi:NADH dehydrogenase [ubiquinone] 1 alpha subcomplex assembly factor 5